MTERPLTQRQIYLKPITAEKAFSLMDEELKDRVFQDFDDLDCMPKSHMYIGCMLNNTYVGYFSLKQVNRHVVDIHINIQKEYRGYGKLFSDKILSNLFSDPLIKRIESSIPVIYPDMLKFVQKLGFTEEGEKRSSFLKGGKWHNLKIIGILREDYGKCKLK